MMNFFLFDPLKGIQEKLSQDCDIQKKRRKKEKYLNIGKRTRNRNGHKLYESLLIRIRKLIKIELIGLIL